MKRKHFQLALLLLFVAACIVVVRSISLGATHSAPLSTKEKGGLPTVQELYTLTNVERSRAGVAPLQLDSRLNASAQAKADEIAATGVFEHVGSTGKRGLTYIDESGIRCEYRSENLGEGTDSKQTIDGLMGSPAHRAAIVDAQYELVGFGVSMGEHYPTTVQHFCNLP